MASSLRCSSPKVTTCSTASKTFSHEVRKASAVSFNESRRAQRARNNMYARACCRPTELLRRRPPHSDGNRRVAWNKAEKPESPKRNELKTPFGELIIAGGRLM